MKFFILILICIFSEVITVLAVKVDLTLVTPDEQKKSCIHFIADGLDLSYTAKNGTVTSIKPVHVHQTTFNCLFVDAAKPTQLLSEQQIFFGFWDVHREMFQFRFIFQEMQDKKRFDLKQTIFSYFIRNNSYLSYIEPHRNNMTIDTFVGTVGQPALENQFNYVNLQFPFNNRWNLKLKSMQFQAFNTGSRSLPTSSSAKLSLTWTCFILIYLSLFRLELI